MNEVPWEKIRGMRNHLAHAYFDIDLETLWLVVQRDLPPLLAALERYLEKVDS